MIAAAKHLPAFILVLGLTSCSTLQRLRLRPESGRESAGVPATFSAATATVALPERWWETFESTELNGLMTTAFANNLSLAKAWTRLRRAEALATAAQSEGRLQLGANASAEGREQRVAVRGSSSVVGSHSVSTGLTLSYELDLWGRIHATTETALLNVKASEQDVATSALALSGQIADTWIRVKGTQLELSVLESQLQTTQQYLDLLKARQRKAMSAAVDVLQQEQRVASLQSAMFPLQERLATRHLQLAYLLGCSPDALPPLGAAELPTLPPLPDPGLPAALLEQRPDIQAAWYRLQSQDWAVVTARADRLPALRLTGSGSSTAEDVGGLFDTWALALVGGLTAPLVDGGRRRAEVVRQRALADERFLDYRDTVLIACHEVQDALTTETWRTSYVAGLESELDVATRTLEETRRRYLKGVSDYLPVLTALVTTQLAERSLVGARADLLLNRVALFRALGGTWMSRLEDTR